MSKAEEVNTLEYEIVTLKEKLKTSDIVETNQLMKEINYLKHEIETILEKVRYEETFFD